MAKLPQTQFPHQILQVYSAVTGGALVYNMHPKFSTRHFYKKIIELAKSRKWGVGSNAFAMDRGDKIIIRRFDIGIYREYYDKHYKTEQKISPITSKPVLINNGTMLKYRLDDFLVGKIKELIPHIVGREIKIFIYDDIKDTDGRTQSNFTL